MDKVFPIRPDDYDHLYIDTTVGEINHCSDSINSGIYNDDDTITLDSFKSAIGNDITCSLDGSNPVISTDAFETLYYNSSNNEFEPCESSQRGCSSDITLVNEFGNSRAKCMPEQIMEVFIVAD